MHQQRVINYLLSSGWVQNGSSQRLRKGVRRVNVGETTTSFSVEGNTHYQTVPTRQFNKIKELAR